MDGNPVKVWQELSSKVEEKIESLRSNFASAHSWFDEYYELAKAKVEGPGGAPTFVPKVGTFLLYSIYRVGNRGDEESKSIKNNETI